MQLLGNRDLGQENIFFLITFFPMQVQIAWHGLYFEKTQETV